MTASADLLELEACRVDLPRATVIRPEGDRVSLTTREVDLLRYLCARPSQPVSRDQLISTVWGYSDAVVTRACDTTVRRLRAKIEADPSNPVHVVTEFGSGYRFEPLRSAMTPAPPVPAEPPMLALGEILVDFARRRVVRPGAEDLPLTSIEAALLDRLARAAGGTVEARQLLQDIWGGPQHSRPLATAIHRLRAKLGDPAADPRIVITVRGGGYRLVVPPPATVGDTHHDRFVGRQEASARLEAALAESRCVVVIGTGGIGKTRLLRRVVAHRSPVWWVELAHATTADQACAAVGRALGMDLGGTADPIGRIGHALGHRGPGLLVLDNLEQLGASVAGLIGAWLATAPQLRIAGTSRVRLDVDGESLVLDPLTLDEGVELFGSRARAASGSVRLEASDRGPIRELVTRLDGLPLAIELAAARLPVLGPTELLERLDRRLDLLSRPKADIERHRSLRAVIAGSWALLHEAEVQALLRLSWFGAGFGIQDAEGLLGDEALDLLQALRDGSFVTTRSTPPTFGVLESIRAFAAEQRAAQADGGRAADLDWVRWLGRLGEADHLGRLVRGESAEAATAHDDAVGDLVVAAQVALRWAEPELAAACVLAAASARGVPETTCELAATVLATPGLGPLTRVRTSIAHAILLKTLERITEATERAIAGADLAAEIGELALVGQAYRVVSGCYADQRRLEDAAGAAERAAAAFTDAQQLHLAAWCHGRAHAMRGDSAGEVKSLEAVVAAGLRAGDRVLAAQAVVLLGRRDYASGRPGAARLRFEEGLRLLRETRRWELVLSAILDLVIALQTIGDHLALEAVAVEGIEITRRIAAPADEVVIWIYVAGSRAALGDSRGCREAAALARTAFWAPLDPNPRQLACIELREAEGLLLEGDVGSAVALARDGRDRFARVGDDRNVALARGVLSRALAAAGELDEARAEADLAVEVMRASGATRPYSLALVLAQRGQVAAARGERAEAERDLREAERIARSVGVGQAESESGAEMARLRRALGDPGE